MRSLVVGLFIGALFVGVAGYMGADSAKADNGPHIQGHAMTTDACAGCHRAHTAQGPYLLKVDEAALCQSCHDGSGATTNVLDGVQLDAPGGSVNGALRGGGFNNARIDTEDPSWRFSKQCQEDPAFPLVTPVPGYPTVICDDGDANPGEFARVTMCGVLADMSDIANCSVSTNSIIGLGYQNPETWLLHINVLPGPEPVTSTHTVGAVDQTVWGSGLHEPLNGGVANAGATGAELHCTSCHDPHGNGQYRILRQEPASHVAGAGLAGSTFAGVIVPDACPTHNTSCNAGNLHDYSTENYMNTTYVTWYNPGTIPEGDPAEIVCVPGGDVPGFAPVADHGPECPADGTYNPRPDGGNTLTYDPASSPEGIAAWCAQCHTRYLARGQYATNSGDDIFTYRHSGYGSASYNGRQCTACHVAHGTNATASGIVAAEVLTPDGLSASGSALLKMDNRGMCLKCHKR